MRSISIIFILCLLFLFGFVVYLAVQNRDSAALRSKLFPALVIGLVGALFTIWFSLKSEKIDLQFTSTLFFHKLDKKVLDEHYRNQHKFGGPQFDVTLRNFINTRIEEDQELKKAVFNENSNKIKEFYYDMVFIKLLSRFFWMYADWWDVRVNSVRRGNSVLSTVTAVKPDPDYDSLRWEDFLGALNKENDFCKLLSSFSEKYWIKKMTVPPKTKVEFITSSYRRSLVLKNPFTRVSITLDKRTGSIGLGDYTWLLGYDNKKSEEFWSEHFEVTCKAKFEKFRSGHPKMTRYKRWVETMFAEIQYQLADDERLMRARDYRDLFSQTK